MRATLLISVLMLEIAGHFPVVGSGQKFWDVVGMIKEDRLAEMQAMRKTGTAFESWEDQKGRTLLYFAVFLEKEDVVRYLVGDLKSDVNHVDRIGGTPLTKAIWTGNFKLCNFLCRNGADVLQRDHYGNTPLIIAALMGDLNIAKLLVDHGAHLKDTNHRGKRAEDYAHEKRHLELIRYFLDQNGVGYYVVAHLLSAKILLHSTNFDISFNFVCNYSWFKIGVGSFVALAVGWHRLKSNSSKVCCHRSRSRNFFVDEELPPNAVDLGPGCVSCPCCRHKIQKHEWRKVFLEKGIVCPVCRNKVKRDPPLCGPCGHVVCQSCVRTWSKQRQEQVALGLGPQYFYDD